MKKESDVKASLKKLDNQIKEKNEILVKINKDIAEKRRVDGLIDNIYLQLNQIKKLSADLDKALE